MSKESQSTASTRSNMDIDDPAYHRLGRHPVAPEDDVVAALTWDGGLHIAVQPQVRLSDGERVGAMVCASLVHPKRGSIASESYLPVIGKLGLDLLLFYRLAARTILLQRYLVAENIRLPTTIRLPTAVLQIPDVSEMLDAWMLRHNLPNELLRLELDKPSVDDDPSELGFMLGNYQAKGFGISLDGFGFDHQLLKFLTNAPGGRVKIGKNTIADMHNDDGASRVSMLIRLARVLEIGVVADGIERQEQLDQLRMWGCEFGQGPLFAVPAEMTSSLYLANSHGSVT